MLFKTSIVAVALAALSFVTVDAHVALRSPCPRYGSFKGCPAPPSGQSIDYNIRTPIGTHDSQNFPICKNTKPYSGKRTVYKAGQTIKTDYDVGAAHGGGHCQWALSYDNGKTWVVIHTIIRDCLRGVPNYGKYTANVKIPANAPSGKVTFMWLWNNAIGNRELYSNCADIEIKGKDGGKISGVAPLFANYGRKSQYIGEFPNKNDKDGREHFDRRKKITVTVPKSKK
ncbi:hypothetical protein BGZ94_001629 [Podila epigama]|nr:hypothetical protein BGZ94_001629 [Podila epigama]